MSNLISRVLTIEYRLVESGTERVLITYSAEGDAVRAWCRFSTIARERIRIMRAVIETETTTIETISYFEWSKPNV